MTTDITELAQRVKTEASAIDDTQWYLAKPSEIRSLVEALEKAQSKLAKIKSNSCHVDTSDGAFIPNSLDAWGLPVPQHLPYDFSGNPGASATQYCNGWNDAGGYWLNYVRELEPRTVTVKLPPRVDSSNVPFAAHTWNCCLAEVEKRLTTAGIKVEAE